MHPLQDLERVIAALREGGGTSAELRRELAALAFARTAAYDAVIADWFGRETGAGETRTIVGRLRECLRYGENPHQSAALYAGAAAGPSIVDARQVQGKPLGYNNIADADAALELAAEFDPSAVAAAVIVKHANPCGVALAEDLETAYARALECDPVSAYGGIIAVNRPLDAAAAARIVTLFTEVVVAPDADEAALALFAKRRNLRLLLTGSMPDARAAGETFRSVRGGFLLQSADRARLTAGDLKIVTKRAPSEREVEDMLFAFTIAKHVKSNAIVFAKDGRTAGIGAGQMNRRDSARIAALRALESAHLAGRPVSFAEGSACASDAFFPFPDGLIQAAEAGATAVI